MRILSLFAAVLIACIPASVTSARDKAPIHSHAFAALKDDAANIARFYLPNGMLCLVREDRSAPVVSLQIWVGVGSSHEQEHLGAGLSHAIEHMIFKGTDKRNPGDISREINNAGGFINAYTALDRTVFHADLPANKWKVGLDVLADAVMNAKFPEEEWIKEKNVILREFAMGEDDPNRVISKLLMRTAYDQHPYRVPVIGYEDVFRQITVNDIRTFFKRHYVPDNIMIVIVGNVGLDETKQEINKVFEPFKRQSWSHVNLPQEPRHLSPRFERQIGEYSLTQLEIAYHTVAITHKDAPVLDVLAQIVGHGRSSRLNKRLKENLRLVHSINAWSYTPREPGLFGISASFDPGKEKDVITAIERELNSWRSLKFSRKEITKAQRTILCSELASLQTMKGKAGSYASGQFYAGDAGFSIKYLEQVNAVTAKHLRETIQKYLHPDNSTLVILAPSDMKKEHPDFEQIPASCVQKTVLPTGIPLLTRQDVRLPFVYMVIACQGGLLSEDASNNGITRLMANLLSRGTRQQTSDQIAEKLETIGAEMSAFSSRNDFGLRAKCLSSDIKLVLEILADSLINPTFPEKEIEKEKIIQIAAISRQRDRPMHVAQMELAKALFPDHPYRWSPLGTEETVKAISRNNLVEHWKKHVTAGNITISVFGDITQAQAETLCQKYLRRIPTQPSSNAKTHTIKIPSLPTRSQVKEPREQSIVLIGAPGVDMKDRRVDALSVLQTTLSGLSSTLAMEIREKRGMVYYIGAYQQADLQPGNFVLYAGTREDVVPEVEAIILKEIDRISSDGLSLTEFERARNQIIAGYEMSLQNNMAVATRCALDELHGLGYSHMFTTRKRFETITRKEVLEATRTILSRDRVAVSIVLPNTNNTVTEE
ncbi:MAG: insulinase family protein [Lentisphaerae bacterium]|nr:insulinase family protein [Lentisphaerota bacterium]